MRLLLTAGLLMAATALIAQPTDNPRHDLAEARRQADAARQRSAHFAARARTARDDATRARAAQAAVAAQVQATEADMAAAHSRLALLDQLRRDRERRLAQQQQPIIKLVAALQTMARRPAAAALVQPGSISDIIHVRALLDTITPQIAARSQGLRAQVEQTRRLRAAAAAAVAPLQESRRQHDLAQRHLLRIEARQRASAIRYASVAAIEAERARALGESARDLQELVRTLDIEARLRDRLAGLPGPLPRPARLSEALPAAQADDRVPRLAYRLPVIGRISRGFGEVLPSGARSSGVHISARPGALVVAPASGRVTFAGLYRGYGAIAIVDHGGGYASLLTGLASNSARIGDAVEGGSPLGRAGATPITVELRREGVPVALTAFIG